MKNEQKKLSHCEALSADMQHLAQQLEVVLHSHLDALDGSHDIHHSRRVLDNALQIMKLEGRGDEKLLVAGAYLHDLVNVAKNSPDRARASQLSADAAAPILQDLGFNNAECEQTQHIIVAHSFSANVTPNTIEAKILQDADRLEAIGAIGIARVFYIAGKLDSQLFDGEDPFGQTRELNDKVYALDHFKIKLLGLCDTMQTAAGKTVADARTETMLGFLDDIAAELLSENPWRKVN